MRRLFFIFILPFLLAAPEAPAQQEILRAGNDLSFGGLAAADLPFGSSAVIDAASAGTETGVLEGCPGFKAFQLADTYPDPSSGLREVSETSPDALPLPADDMDRAGLLTALGNTLAYWQKKPDTFEVLIGKDYYSAAWMRRTTQKLIDLFSANMSPEELRAALKTQFHVYRSVSDDGSGKVVITGYYEAEIKAARQPDAVNRFPIYLKPADLVKTTPAMGLEFDYGRVDENGGLVRYYSRQEISNGILAGKGLELVWSEHPAWIMLLQIQGSGILRFADGDFIKAGFDGANGWPFKSVQKILMDCGEIKSMSFKNFINYLTAQGERESRLVDLNSRYVFFRTQPKDSPVYGAMGLGLTPGRSIAVDPAPIPLGATALLSSRRPVAGADGSLSFRDFTRFVTAQDTGSAIRGPGRIDLFWGGGDTAFTEASSMKAPGDLFILIAK
jgi:membrane-bound lytic murein transglycosylase A